MDLLYADPVRTDPELARRVGVAIEVARDLKGWTQDQLATAAGTSISTISRYESGTTDSHAQTMFRTARALDVPLEWLMAPPPGGRQEVFEALALLRAQRRIAGLGPS